MNRRHYPRMDEKAMTRLLRLDDDSPDLCPWGCIRAPWVHVAFREVLQHGWERTGLQCGRCRRRWTVYERFVEEGAEEVLKERRIHSHYPPDAVPVER